MPVVPVPPEIIAHYTHDADEARRITEGFGELELVRTREIISRHLPDESQRVLDVGGAAGVHARWLAQGGHTVHVIDPVERHVRDARRLAEESLPVTAEVGDARALDIASESVDAVLLLGPLYHLTERADRIAALREAARVVHASGLVFVAAISRFASLFDGLGREFLFDPAFRSIVERDLRDGQHRNPEHRDHWFTTAFFHHPDDLAAEVSESGLELVELLGLEGLAAYLPHLAQRWDDPDARSAILYSARATEREPALLGLSAHLLCVARRPYGSDE
jgi:ubiquinone/menaquinone biosynthesis C-methylase UbiE